MDLPDLLNLYKLDDATAVNLGESGIFQDVIPLVEQYSNGNIIALHLDLITLGRSSGFRPIILPLTFPTIPQNPPGL